ncbi:MAG TPA: hypothetical protein VK512_08145 [Xanthobacteraceae bacterium]|nr:hypothetical protein [Xanthobacteraceae bacterium]
MALALEALSNPELEPVGDFVEPRMMLDDAEDEPLKLPANVAPSGFETISAAIEKQVHDQERGALVSVGKSVISRQRFRESCGFPLDRAVVTRERPSDRRFKQTPIADSSQAAKAKRLLMRFDDVLDSDAIVPYGGSALGQPFEGIRSARRGIPNARRGAPRRERPGFCVPVNGRAGASYLERLFATGVSDGPTAGR